MLHGTPIAEVWGAAIGAVVGGGIAMYGANKQSKDTAHAQDQNLAAQAAAEQTNWDRYLMQRGIAAPNVPGYAAGTPINTRLPLWMKVVQPNLPRQAKPNVPFLIPKVA